LRINKKKIVFVIYYFHQISIDILFLISDPAAKHRTPPPPTKSSTQTTPKSFKNATKPTENGIKKPLTPAPIDKPIEKPPKTMNNLPKVAKSKEDGKDETREIPIKLPKTRPPAADVLPPVEEAETEEEEVTRRITRNTEIGDIPERTAKPLSVAKTAEKEKNQEKSPGKSMKNAKPNEPHSNLMNGFDLPRCIIPLRKVVVSPKETTTYKEQQTSITSSTKIKTLSSQQQITRLPLDNSTPIKQVTRTTPLKKRKNNQAVLYINPMCLSLVKHNSVKPVQQPAPKRPRIVVPPTNAATTSSSLVRHRATNTSSGRRAPVAPPAPPPFRIRDPVLIEKELQNLQSHYKRLKDENGRIHQENARLFLVNSRLQSENGRLRASAIMTNSKLKLENEKLRAASELYKGERVREQNEAELAVEEMEMLKDELEEARKECDDLREQLQTALTAANNAMIAAAAAENESTTTEAASAKKKAGAIRGVTTPTETLVLANKVYKVSGSKVYETLRPVLKFPALRTLLAHKRKNEALFATTDEENDAD
jgi:hypothetical protein